MTSIEAQSDMRTLLGSGCGPDDAGGYVQRLVTYAEDEGEAFLRHRRYKTSGFGRPRNTSLGMLAVGLIKEMEFLWDK